MKYTETYYKVLLHIHFIVCKIRPAWHNYRMQDNHSCVTHSVREKHVYILDGCGSNRQSSSWFNLDTSWMGSQEWVMGLGLGGFLIYNVFRFLNPVYKVIKGSSPKSENSFTIYSPSCPKCEWIFLLQNTEDDILKNVAPIYFHWMDTKKTVIYSSSGLHDYFDWTIPSETTNDSTLFEAPCTRAVFRSSFLFRSLILPPEACKMNTLKHLERKTDIRIKDTV